MSAICGTCKTENSDNFVCVLCNKYVCAQCSILGTIEYDDKDHMYKIANKIFKFFNHAQLRDFCLNCISIEELSMYLDASFGLSLKDYLIRIRGNKNG